ncbi:hypothetical protein [Streptomyces sp. YIM 130001]|uniref:hypothetical protein n=1 Tax=Streptomyces sp. YIM 130001 TaxID=2259644 RepID=UPI001F0909CD|nr:hypothetical protein [Streptomyces sp. YIM 130001]
MTTSSPNARSPLPPFPPELPYAAAPSPYGTPPAAYGTGPSPYDTGPSAYGTQARPFAPTSRHELLALRAEALRVLVGKDLAPVRLVSGTLLALAVGTVWVCLIGTVDDLTREGGDPARAVFAAIVGVLAAVGCAFALVRGREPRRHRQRLLHTWAAWHQHPAVTATPVAHDPDHAPRASGRYGLRILWMCAAAVAVLFGLVLVSRGAGNDRALHSVGFGGLGLVLLAAAARGGWKACRLAQRVRFTGIDEIPGAEHLSPRSPSARGTKPLGTASLRDPRTRLARFTIRTPAWAVTCGSTLVAALTAVAASGIAGVVVLVAGAVIALALVIAIGAYDYRPRYAVPALIAAICLAGFGFAASEARILADRGVWVDGVVTDVRKPRGKGSPSCGVRDEDGKPLAQRVSQCHDYEPGDPVRVIVDPEAEASPSFSTPSPDGLAVATAVSALVFVATATTGMSRGHRNRSRLLRAHRFPHRLPSARDLADTRRVAGKRESDAGTDTGVDEAAQWHDRLGWTHGLTADDPAVRAAALTRLADTRRDIQDTLDELNGMWRRKSPPGSSRRYREPDLTRASVKYAEARSRSLPDGLWDRPPGTDITRWPGLPYALCFLEWEAKHPREWTQLAKAWGTKERLLKDLAVTHHAEPVAARLAVLVETVVGRPYRCKDHQYVRIARAVDCTDLRRGLEAALRSEQD